MKVGDLDRFVFIVGAPRCGTTTLAQFLKEHPAVSFPIIKEPHYFAQNDLRGLSDHDLRDRVEEEYLGPFFRRDTSLRIGADASVTYLYTPEQLEPVLRLWPDSRFIVALRNPLAMLPSLHGRLVYVGVEPVGKFEEAWAAARGRLARGRALSGLVDPLWLRYDEAARFATYLERLFSVVGRERCLVMILDDMVANPSEQYRRFMDFVDLEPVRTEGFEVHRAGRGVRSLWLQRMLKRPNILLRRSAANGKKAQPINLLTGNGSVTLNMILAVRRQMLRLNRTQRGPAPISASIQAEICSHFEQEVERLTSLIGRDLTHWLRLRA